MAVDGSPRQRAHEAGLEAAAAAGEGRSVLFVANLPYSIGVQELHGVFGSSGKVLSASVAIDYLGQSRGFGFVAFGSREEAQRAVAAVNGKSLVGRSLTVDIAPLGRRRQ